MACSHTSESCLRSKFLGLKRSNAVNLTAGLNTAGIRLSNTSQTVDRGGLTVGSADAVSTNTGLSGAKPGNPCNRCKQQRRDGLRQPHGSKQPCCERHCHTGLQHAYVQPWHLDGCNWTNFGDSYGLGQYGGGIQRMFCSGYYAPATCALSYATGSSTSTDMLTANKAGIKCHRPSHTGCHTYSVSLFSKSTQAITNNMYFVPTSSWWLAATSANSGQVSSTVGPGIMVSYNNYNCWVCPVNGIWSLTFQTQFTFSSTTFNSKVGAIVCETWMMALYGYNASQNGSLYNNGNQRYGWSTHGHSNGALTSTWTGFCSSGQHIACIINAQLPTKLGTPTVTAGAQTGSSFTATLVALS